MSTFASQQADLEKLAALDRLRMLVPRHGADFSSNDYLGLAGSPRLAGAVVDAIGRGVPVGAGGSRLLRGNDPEHEALEEDAARFFRAGSALFFASGYAANLALFATVPQRDDLVVHDALIHASARDGLRLGRAQVEAAEHNDPDAFDDRIRRWRDGGGTGRPWIAVESLYSMDGDQAPLADLATVAARHDAVLVIDEAHATGVFGEDGRGLACPWEGSENVVVLHTCGKAMGCEGALLTGPRTIRDFIVNRGRPFIFSTAPSPLMASAVRESLRMLRDEPERRERLGALIALAEDRLGAVGVVATGSQILPLILGEDAATMRAAEALQARGYDVRGIRPPTVPAGTARLRISLTLNASPADVEGLADALSEALA